MPQKTLCPLCGQDIPPNARFCPSCGASLQRRHSDTGLLNARHLLHNRYAIDRKLAQGGQSAVYLAHDTIEGNAQRAIKEMSDANLTHDERQKAINDFMREARMLYNLDHFALARVYDIFVEGNRYYLVMEYVPGHNLEDEMVVYRKEPLDWEEVMGWGIALCDVLAYLHAQEPPIIYRDLKPANVMLLPDKSIKLIDFGIARWLHPARLTDTMQLGTDGYAPLEQYSSHSEPRSDMYALGASLYHLVTGRVPEAAPIRTAGRTLTPIRSINPRVPEPVERVIHQALNLQAHDRFPSDLAMRDALLWALRQAKGMSAMPGAPDGSGTSSGVHTSLPRERAPFGSETPLAPNVPIAPLANRISGAPQGAGRPNQMDGRKAAQQGVPPGGVYIPGAASVPGASNAARPMGAAKRTGVMPPHLSVWPLRLDAGAIEVGSVVTYELQIANQGGGQLAGRTETNLDCLIVEPAIIDEETASVRVNIDAHGLPLGPYKCHVAIWTNGGDQIIQVRFEVRPLGDPYVARGRLTE